MTLTELANELRKMFNFKYLTADLDLRTCEIVYMIWNVRPIFDEYVLHWCPYNMLDNSNAIAIFKKGCFNNIDLREYGIVHYGDHRKCIVEV